MKTAIISSSSLGGPDNPTGRWDAAYNLFIEQLKNGAATETDWLYAIKGSTGIIALRDAETLQAVEAALLIGLDLVAPSPEVAAGIHQLAIRIVQGRITTLKNEAQELQDEAEGLRLSLLPDSGRACNPKPGDRFERDNATAEVLRVVDGKIYWRSGRVAEGKIYWRSGPGAELENTLTEWSRLALKSLESGATFIPAK